MSIVVVLPKPTVASVTRTPELVPTIKEPMIANKGSWRAIPPCLLLIILPTFSAVFAFYAYPEEFWANEYLT